MTSKLMTATAVRAAFGGVSDMTLWRWINDPALNFPKPIRIQACRYFHESEVTAWLEQREVA